MNFEDEKSSYLGFLNEPAASREMENLERRYRESVFLDSFKGYTHCQLRSYLELSKKLRSVLLRS